MNKKEVAEIKKRFTRKNASFSRMAGCYVDAEHEKVCSFAETFLNLPEDEIFKYLEIAGKAMSGSVGNNLLTLGFTREAEAEDGMQAMLLALRDSGLKDQALLEQWYDTVIGRYKRVGNYLILLYMDTYDVPKKTSDGLLLDESEDVFSYILCALCPVELSKPGLGYKEEDNCFGACSRSWVVSAPESGFLFPAFNDRSADVHEVLFYTKDTKEPHEEFMTEILGCTAALTASEQKISFGSVLHSVLGEAEEAADKTLDIQQNLQDLRVLHEMPEDDTPYQMTAEVLENALENSQVTKIDSEKIVKAVEELFGDAMPPVGHVVDSRALKANEYRIERNSLQKALQEAKAELAAAGAAEGEYDVVLKLSGDKAERLDTRYIDGERYLLIPVEDSERISVNGEETEI